MKNSIILNFLLFTGFLLIGYSFSTRFYPPDYSHNLDSAPGLKEGVLNSIQTLNNGQRSFLLIGVDSIETSKPELKSLWLVTYLPSDPTIHFLPILPSGNMIETERESQIFRSFALVRLFDLKSKKITLVPGQKFTKVLEKNNYWWSGYFIFDQAGLQKMLEVLNLKSAEENNSEQRLDLESSSLSGDQGDEFSSQVMVLQSICHEIGELAKGLEISEVITKLSTYIVSNLDIHQISLEWDATITNGSTFNCKFPTLQVAPNSH